MLKPFTSVSGTEQGSASARVTRWLRHDNDDTVRFELRLENDQAGEIDAVAWPAAMAFAAEAGAGATVLPYMQGALIPARWPKAVDNVGGGIIFERSAYLPVFGQIRHGTGYAAIFDTPFDARYDVRHEAGGDTRVQPLFVPSLGLMRYRRILLLRFAGDCDHNTIAKLYRDYVRAKGRLVTLAEKIARNPAVSRLIRRRSFKKACRSHQRAVRLLLADIPLQHNFVVPTRADS